MKDKKNDENNNKTKKSKSKIKKDKNENKDENKEQFEQNNTVSPNLQCLKIQVNSHITEFLYYQRYPKKNNAKYDPKFCALVYYFNEDLDDKFFYLYFSLMGQIDELFFGSFFGHNNKIKSYSKKKDDNPKIIHFAIIKYVEEESLNILLDCKQAQTLINNYLIKTRNYKLDFQYDPIKDEENNIEEENIDEDGNKKNPEEDFVLVSSNTAKNNFSFNGVSFKVAKEKNKVDIELDEDEDENSEMPNLKKKKKKKNKGNDFYWNFQLLDKKRTVKDELEQLFAKDKEVIERKKKLDK